MANSLHPSRRGLILGAAAFAAPVLPWAPSSAAETLPGYMARYKDIEIPMAMLYGRGDRLLDSLQPLIEQST